VKGVRCVSYAGTSAAGRAILVLSKRLAQCGQGAHLAIGSKSRGSHR
jgi:hypothetical protein